MAGEVGITGPEVSFGALSGRAAPLAASPRGLRLGRPSSYFFDQLDPEVAHCLNAAIDRLSRAGVEIVPCDFPEILEGEEIYAPMVISELVAVLGREQIGRAHV